jgi:hypothetical protein
MFAACTNRALDHRSRGNAIQAPHFSVAMNADETSQKQRDASSPT